MNLRSERGLRAFLGFGAAALALAIGGTVGYQMGHAPAPVAINKTSLSSSADDGTWVVSSDPGPNVPAVGRSLFDHLTMVDAGGGQKKQVIPFPFPKLMDAVRARLRPESQTPGFGLKNVLIPLGRSLQRSASAPDFFRFPRAVIGVDGYPLQDGQGTGMLLRDRLYVGYNEKAAVLEIISYNETAGRYEYQVAHNYRDGAKPEIVYSNRSVCLSCHQNATPIFSDRPWQETNAHADISSRLLAGMAGAPASVFDGKNYMGIPLSVPEAQPQGIDNTKFRANLLPATHYLWQRLCEKVDGSTDGSARCRAQVLALALRMGFTNQLDATTPLFYSASTLDLTTKLSAAWTKQWPGGLIISSPRIPNRNPFEKPRNPNPFDVSALKPEVAGQLGDLVKHGNIPAEFEPLNKRPAFDKWTITGAAETNGLANWLRQLTAFFTDLDYKLIDQLASRKAQAANARTQVTAACDSNTNSANKVSFTCEGGLMDPMRIAGFISWDANGKASGAFENLAIRSVNDCDISLGAEQSSCPEAQNLVVRGQVTTGADGVLQATLQAVNKINGQRTRFSDGNLLESLQLRWKAGTQVAVAANVLKDFSFIEQILNQAVQETVSGKSTLLAKQPFRRLTTLAYLRAGLGGAATDAGDCCEADSGMPAAKSEEGATVTDAQLASIMGPAVPFMKECAVCHRNNNGFPTNYLAGTLTDVQKQLVQCAERIWYRVNMYDVEPASRGTSPMPPMSRLSALGLSDDQWKHGAALKDLKGAATELLKLKGISPPPDPRRMNFPSLPACFGNAQ